MKCPNCGFENPEGAKFCSNCGTKLNELKACTNPSCPEFGKHILPQDSSFCPTCGKPINEDVKKKQEPTSHKFENIGRQVDNRGNIEKNVKAIIIDKLGADESAVTNNATFIDLGADSLDTVELIMEFEKEFGISIPDEDTQKISTVADAICYVQKMSNN